MKNKNILKLALSIFLIAGLVFSYTTRALAVHVSGYFRSNGTYVHGYERSAPDGNPYNNYGFPGNYNPNTGEISGGSIDAYLRNYYKSSSYPSSYINQTSLTNSIYNYQPIVHSCPANAYYDGSKCTCSAGYVMSNNSCLSWDSFCHNSLGYYSNYNAITDSCECDVGYNLDVNTHLCTRMTTQDINNQTCIDHHGNHSLWNGNTSDDGIYIYCSCQSGYQFNDANQCVLKPVCPNHSSPMGNSCICDNDTISRNGQCLTYTEDCISAFGNNVIGVKGNDGNSLCYCINGYHWNSDQTSCINY